MIHLPAPLGRPGRLCPLHLCLALPIIAGLFPLGHEDLTRWGWSGAWLYPVGDPHALGVPASDRSDSYRVMRNLIEGGPEARKHQGADLSSGHGGDPVRAAANGLVVQRGWERGYGNHLVIAHRFTDGTLAYSVYAHLAPKSMRVREGQRVYAGQRLGRIGMTGRATSPHLHFEVRVPEDPEIRWEHAGAVDPLEFVNARLPRHADDTTWARPYLEWGECFAMLGHDGDAGAPLLRRDWWRMLAAAARLADAALPTAPESLRRRLLENSLLETGGEHEGGRVGWKEMRDGLQRLRRHGHRLPWSPVARSSRAADCLKRLGLAGPAKHLSDLGQGSAVEPSEALACLVLADLAGDAPKAKAKAKAKPKPPAARPRPAAPSAGDSLAAATSPRGG